MADLIDEKPTLLLKWGTVKGDASFRKDEGSAGVTALERNPASRVTASPDYSNVRTTDGLGNTGELHFHSEFSVMGASDPRGYGVDSPDFAPRKDAVLEAPASDSKCSVCGKGESVYASYHMPSCPKGQQGEIRVVDAEELYSQFYHSQHRDGLNAKAAFTKAISPYLRTTGPVSSDPRIVHSLTYLHNMLDRRLSHESEGEAAWADDLLEHVKALQEICHAG